MEQEISMYMHFAHVSTIDETRYHNFLFRFIESKLHCITVYT